MSHSHLKAAGPSWHGAEGPVAVVAGDPVSPPPLARISARSPLLAPSKAPFRFRGRTLPADPPAEPHQ